MGCVYAACFPNKKLYIGQTTRTLKERKRQHKDASRRSSILLYNAIRKYGWKNIEWKVLIKSKDPDELNRLERWYIKKFDTMNRQKGYNLKEGGNSAKLCPSVIKRIAQTQAGENGHNSKICWTQAEIIRKLYKKDPKKFYKTKLANFFGIHRRSIGRILDNKAWKKEYKNENEN